jgi:pSer/pThr/pTyr-binding forkhead associated (FHA) protein
MNSTTKPALSLVVAAGPHEGRTIPLVLPFVIGRAAGCHLRPASALVSHEHCVIENRDGRAVIRDLRSTNGTFLNEDLLLADCPLNDGDEVQVGPLRFIVRIEGAPQRRSGGDTVVSVRAEGETVTDRDHMSEDEAARLLSEGDAADEGTEEHPPVE